MTHIISSWYWPVTVLVTERVIRLLARLYKGARARVDRRDARGAGGSDTCAMETCWAALRSAAALPHTSLTLVFMLNLILGGYWNISEIITECLQQVSRHDDEVSDFSRFFGFFRRQPSFLRGQRAQRRGGLLDQQQPDPGRLQQHTFIHTVIIRNTTYNLVLGCKKGRN